MKLRRLFENGGVTRAVDGEYATSEKTMVMIYGPSISVTRSDT